MKDINDEPTFQTPDLHIAGFLKIKHLRLIGVKRDFAGRCYFIFRDTKDRQSLLLDYANDAPVPVRSLLAAVRDLKGLINTNERNYDERRGQK